MYVYEYGYIYIFSMYTYLDLCISMLFYEYRVYMDVYRV